MAAQAICNRRCSIEVCGDTPIPGETRCAYCRLDHTLGVSRGDPPRLQLGRERMHHIRQALYVLPQAHRINIVERQNFLTQKVDRLRALLLINAEEERSNLQPALQADSRLLIIYTVFPDECFIWGLSSGYWPADDAPSDVTRHLKSSSPWLASDGSRYWQWTSSVTGELMESTPAPQKCHELRSVAPSLMPRPTSPPQAPHKAHAICQQVNWMEINCDLVLPPGMYTVLAWFTNPNFLNWDDGVLESRAGAPWPYSLYRNAGSGVAKITDPYIKRKSRSPDIHPETFCDVLSGVQVTENGYVRVVLFQQGTRMALGFKGLHFIREEGDCESLANTP